MRKLTAKQQRFVDEYLIDFSVAGAAERAGYQFPAQPTDLAYYVYVLIDPLNGEIFYVGKGKHRRAQSHLLLWRRGKVLNAEKHERMTAIAACGGETQIGFLDAGLTEPVALEVEEAFIAAIGLDKLTNIAAKGAPAGDRGLWLGPALDHEQIAREEQRLARWANKALFRLKSDEQWLATAPEDMRNERGMYWFRKFKVVVCELALNLRRRTTEELISGAETVGLHLTPDVRREYLESPADSMELREARCLFAIYPTLIAANGDSNLIKGN